MAGPTLGTLLIQRLDAALGTTLSQQTQIINRATSDPVTHPGQTTRPEPVPNTLVRDSRENVDRALLGGARSGARLDQQQGTGEAAAANRSHRVTTSATTSLGLAARIILNLFASHATAPTPVTARTPLLGNAPHAANLSGQSSGTAASAAAAQSSQSGSATRTAAGSDSTTLLAQTLTRALAQSLQQSGLFYESHLKSLVSGQYRLADIRQEPQAQVLHNSPRAAHAQGAAASSAIAQGQTAHSAAQTSLAPGADTLSSGTTPSGTAPGGGATGTAPTAHSATAQATPGSPATPGIDPATHTIVRQQLETLADQSIHWRGEAWPGAEMDWHIKRHPERRDETPESVTDASAPWQSRIKIQLPRLGDITLDIRLAGAQVYVTVQANENTAPLLQQHAAELQGQMSARQLELTAITFAEPDTEPDAGTDHDNEHTS